MERALPGFRVQLPLEGLKIRASVRHMAHIITTERGEYALHTRLIKAATTGSNGFHKSLGLTVIFGCDLNVNIWMLNQYNGIVGEVTLAAPTTFQQLISRRTTPLPP